MQLTREQSEALYRDALKYARDREVSLPDEYYGALPNEARQWAFSVAGISRTDQLQSVLETLSEREAGVVRLRFGLTDGQPRTLDEIGQVYGVTRERIRQIESKTMSKLRHPSRSQVLRDYLD